MKSILHITILLLFGSQIYAQQATMRLDTSQLRIGEQTVLYLTFEYQNPNGDALIIWPQFEKELTENLEIIGKTIDLETLVDSGSSTYIKEQRLLITGFEQGNYTIPEQTIYLNDSVYESNSLVLQISTVEVDTSKGIADIKPIYSVNYPFSERSRDWFLENWYWIAIIVALIIAFLIWRYLKQKEPEIEAEVLEEIIPAHILALAALSKLKQDEEWKSERKKEYYSTLTDTVRSYLENRFNIHAMEQTTQEIITDLKYASISEDDKVYLRKILREADMVKFAKMTPNDEDAFEYLNKSIDFVNRTKEKETNKSGN